MLNYIVADIKRILKKKTFLLTAGMFICLYILMIFIKSGPTYKENNLMADIHSLGSWFPFFVGLPMFLSVFADDLKTKTMQVAIGFGLSRNKVILSKLIETAILSLLISIVSIAAISLVPVGIGINLNGNQVYTVMITMLIEALHLVGFISICIPPVFFAQNTIGGLIIYVLLSSKMAQLILPMFLEKEFIINIFGHVSKYLLSLNLYEWKRVILTNGLIFTTQVLVTAVYIAAPVVLAMYLFKDRELEF